MEDPAYQQIAGVLSAGLKEVQKLTKPKMTRDEVLAQLERLGELHRGNKALMKGRKEGRTII